MSDAFDPYYQWLGIPPAEQPPNHYRLLGVSLFESNPDVIANAAEQRIVYVRTFQLGKHSDDSQRILNEIAVARVCLLNADKKAEYDARLRSATTPPPVTVHASPAYPSAPPVAALEASAVSAGAMPRRESTRRGAARGRTTKSPLVELVKIIVGGIAGLVIAYCLLLFVFRIDMLDKLSSPKPVESRETAQRPAEPRTRHAESETTSKTTKQAEGKPTLSKPVTRLEPASGAVTPDNVRDAAPAAAEQAKPDTQLPLGQSPAVKPSVEPAQQGTEKAAASDPSTSGVTPKTTKQPAAEPPPAPGPPAASPEGAPPSQLAAETLERIEERLKADAGKASSVAEHQVVAQQSLALAFRVILDSQPELAKRLTTLALTAARKANAEDVKKEATLLLVELDQPISDRLKEKARQFLSKGTTTASDAAGQNPVSSEDAARDAAPSARLDEKSSSGIKSAERRPRLENAPAADLSSQILGSAEFARRQQGGDVFKEFQGVAGEVIRTTLDSIEGKPFSLGSSYSPDPANLTHYFNAGISIRNFPETKTHVFVFASIIGDEVVVRTRIGQRSYDRRGDAREIGRIPSAPPRDWSEIKRAIRLEILRIVQEVVRPKMPKPGDG